MIIRLQKYDIELKYEKAKNMFLADTLLRAFLPAHLEDETKFETINVMKYLPIRKKDFWKSRRKRRKVNVYKS